MKRSKLKEALRPLVKEALSDYLKDSEEETRALQAAHPQLDLKSDLPSEPGSGDNATRGVKTEGLEGDLKAVGAKGTTIQKSGGKTIVRLSNPKLAQKVADRLNDSGEYEVEVAKDGAIVVKYQSPVTTFNESKNYYTQDNVGKARYVVNFHDGKKTHNDGSPFYDIRTFSNKIQRDAFVKDLKSKGYKERVQEASTTAGVPGYQTPYAFSDTGISKDVKKRKIAQQLGYKLVKKEGLKEEMRVNIVKAVPLHEGFRPQLQSPEAKALYDKIDYYVMISSDPHYRQIHKFRVAISKLKNPNDQKQMIQYFNDEFKINWGSAAQSAWEYYKKVD